MIKVDSRVAFIDYIQEHKLPPGVDPKSTEATRILRRSKGYVLVGSNLYKRGLASGILIKCVSMEEGKEILQEIHKRNFSHTSRQGISIWFLLANCFGRCRSTRSPVYQLLILWQTASYPGS
jgi:hypothetical protein